MYDEHVQYIRKILKKLKEKNLLIKLSKCEFYKYSISFLDYIILEKELSPDLKKVQFIEKWPELTIIKEVQVLLGILNYYQKFIKGFFQIAALLTILIRKNARFYFRVDYKEAFKELKR